MRRGMPTLAGCSTKIQEECEAGLGIRCPSGCRVRRHMKEGGRRAQAIDRLCRRCTVNLAVSSYVWEYFPSLSTEMN